MQNAGILTGPPVKIPASLLLLVMLLPLTRTYVHVFLKIKL